MTGQPLPPESAARVAHERRLELYGDVPFPNKTQTWRHKVTGDDVVILGRRADSWVARTATGVLVHVGLDEHANDYRYVSCDHDKVCCPTHQNHTSPHQGCVLR